MTITGAIVVTITGAIVTITCAVCTITCTIVAIAGAIVTITHTSNHIITRTNVSVRGVIVTITVTIIGCTGCCSKHIIKMGCQNNNPFYNCSI